MVALWALRRRLAMGLLLVSASPAPGLGKTVAVYFGSGCFWGRQKDFVDLEREVLGRTDEEVTALVGYAGGRPSGAKTPVCYYHAPRETVYEQLGHAEVTQVVLSGADDADLEEQMAAFSEKFFTQFDRTAHGMMRTDPQDAGPGYRTLVGLPGGMHGNLYSIFREKNINNMKLVEGEGDEDDAVHTVYVMDSEAFPFYPGEMYHQFHNGLGHRFPPDYTRALRATQERIGRVKPTGCPERGEHRPERMFDDFRRHFG